MKRALLAVLLACSCAGEQKPAPAGGVAPPATAKSDVQANAEPKPVADKPPVPMVAPSGAKPPLAERDPWADRTDLFVAPTVTPTTKVNLGAVERFTLPNGLQVIVVPRREVPVINLTLALRVGHSADPLDRSGLAQFTASMLRKGTDKRTSDQIAQAIDFVGGELEASSDDDGTFVACQARAKDLALCLDLLTDVVEHPKFPADEMGEIHDQLNAAVEGAKDSPQSLASEHASNLFFGDDDPRGRPMSKASLDKIDRKALVDFHKAWYAPNNGILAVSGDVDGKAIRGILTKAFGSWKKAALPKRVERGLPKGGELRVRLVDKPDATQSAMVIAGPGIAHGDADFYAVRLMNFALGGGGFSSRLMKVVRSEGGKTYGARSHYDARREPGPFVVSTFTRNSETTATLKLLLDEMAKMRAGGPSAEEIAAAKGNLIGGFGLHLETGGDVARQLLGAELDGLDKDFVQKYPERLNAVTVADATKAAAAHLQPTALVVVGKAEEVKPMLAKAGYVVSDVVAYTDPVSAAERNAAASAKAQAGNVSDADADAGHKLLAAALAAKGDLAKVKDVALSGKGSLTMQKQTMEMTLDEYHLPGKAARQEMSMGPMKVVQIVADGKVVMKQGDQVMELPKPMQEAIMRSLWRDPNFILLHAGEPNVKVRALAPVAEGDARYDALEVISPDGASTTLLLDAKTHLIARMTFTESGKKARIELSDYRPEGGIAFPHTIAQGGDEGNMHVTYSKIEVNKGLAPTLFKP
ncbi:MAG TPA: insulinase family protein [Polyangia bacterium]|nr:insulinase family protein [Polyangia bacterium]